MIITRTPLRISFFGGGTDMPIWYREHGGAVISTTIDQYQYITCRRLMPYWNYKHQFFYGSKCETVTDVDEICHPSIRETLRFFNLGYGLDMHYNSDIPARSGMGSSSAFTVGFVNALYGMEGKMANKRRLAVDAIHIEQDLIHETVGSQDQIAAAFGGLNYIEFKKNGGFFVHPVTIKKSRKEELESHLVLIFSGFSRFASDVEKKKVDNMAKKEAVLNEMQSLVMDALDVLTGNEDIRTFGEMINHTWEMKRSLSDGVSTPAIDELYEKGMKAGATGGKLLGAGGGGFFLFFCEPEKRAHLLSALDGYLHIPFHFEENGSQVIYYREDA